MNKKFIFLIFFLLLISCVSGEKIINAQTSENVASIVYPKIPYIIENDYFEVHAHFSNGTGYVLPNTYIDCALHVYNVNGDHIIEDNMTKDDNGIDMCYNITAAIIDGNKFISYNIWCNSSQGEAAFASDYSQVTFHGDEPSDNYLPIILCVAFFSFLLLYSSFNMKSEKLDYIKTLMFPIGILFAGILLFIPVVITLNPTDVSSFNNVAEGLFTVSGILMITFAYFYGLHLFKNIFNKKL